MGTTGCDDRGVEAKNAALVAVINSAASDSVQYSSIVQVQVSFIKDLLPGPDANIQPFMHSTDVSMGLDESLNRVESIESITDELFLTINK
jgi:hypothetical protein